MKKAIIISGFIISSLLIMSLISALDTNSTDLEGTNFSRCILNCVNISQTDKPICFDNYYNGSLKCTDNFRSCLLNNINSTNISKKDLSKNIRDCNKNYTSCKKNIQAARDSCIKDVNNDSKVCKKQCELLKIKPCPTNHNPVCGADNITYNNDCELQKANITKDCKGKCPCIVEKECIKEGGSIPIISKAPKCCDGLKLIKPMEKEILGISGICTAKCGNGICENVTETNYNCPRDCPIVKNYCKPSDRRKNNACPTIYSPVCGWFNSSTECLVYPCAANYSNSCTACINPIVSYWTIGECPIVNNSTN
jgi:hypothetical protein